MKKLISIAICLIICLTVCGCSIGMSLYFYEDSEKYSTGDATIGDKVEQIDIDWISGEVELRYHDYDSVSVTEQANRELSDNETVKYMLEDGTLHVRFAASGLGNFHRLTKTLTVMIPRASQVDLKVEAIAAKVVSEEIEYGDVDIETVSGDVVIAGNLDNAHVETVSGDIDLELSDYAKVLKLATVSGKTEVTAEADEVRVESTSGDVSLKLKDVPAQMETDNVSGNVVISLPASPSFTAEFDSVSGKFSCEHDYSYADGVYTVGDGGGEFLFNSVSGNVRIK